MCNKCTNNENTLHKPGAIKRVVTLITDSLPRMSKYPPKQNKFISCRGAGAVFDYTDISSGKFPAYSIRLEPSNQVWTAKELRQLADECNTMAEYLEKEEEKRENNKEG